MTDTELLKKILECFVLMSNKEIIYGFEDGYPLENIIGVDAYNELYKRLIDE